jgi:hypothetical protein
MTCNHYWTVTSECPICLREQHDALAARLAGAEALHKSALADCVIAQTRLAKAEAILRDCREPVRLIAIGGARTRADLERAEWTLERLNAWVKADSASGSRNEG